MTQMSVDLYCLEEKNWKALIITVVWNFGCTCQWFRLLRSIVGSITIISHLSCLDVYMYSTPYYVLPKSTDEWWLSSKRILQVKAMLQHPFCMDNLFRLIQGNESSEDKAAAGETAKVQTGQDRQQPLSGIPIFPFFLCASCVSFV